MKRRKRAGVVKPKTKGFRTCVGCGEKFTPQLLLRFVADQESKLLVDRYQKAPGRGVHLCYESACLERAIKTKGFERGLKNSALRIDKEALRASIVEAIEARIESLLSIAGVAKKTMSGMDNLERSIDRIKGFVIAEDVADATRKRIDQWVHRNGLGLVQYGNAESLGRTQGKLSRVAVGICEGKTWQRIATEVERRTRVLVAASSGKS